MGIWSIIGIVFGVIVFLGILRVIFSDRRDRADFGEIILDILFLDLIFDIFDFFD